MRYFIILLLLCLASPAVAGDACEAVEKQSRGHITCVRDDFGVTLKYDSWMSRQVTLASGRYDDLIDSVCAHGGIVREQWMRPFKGQQFRVTHCVAAE